MPKRPPEVATIRLDSDRSRAVRSTNAPLCVRLTPLNHLAARHHHVQLNPANPDARHRLPAGEFHRLVAAGRLVLIADKLARPRRGYVVSVVAGALVFEAVTPLGSSWELVERAWFYAGARRVESARDALQSVSVRAEKAVEDRQHEINLDCIAWQYAQRLKAERLKAARKARKREARAASVEAAARVG